MLLANFQRQPFTLFYKSAVSKNFPKIPRKDLCWSVCFKSLQVHSSQPYLKSSVAQVFLKNSLEKLLRRTGPSDCL